MQHMVKNHRPKQKMFISYYMLEKKIFSYSVYLCLSTIKIPFLKSAWKHFNLLNKYRRSSSFCMQHMVKNHRPKQKMFISYYMLEKNIFSYSVYLCLSTIKISF